MTRTRSAMVSTAAALLALLMLSFASIQSAVMRASMSPLDDMGPMCGAPAGMAKALSTGLERAQAAMSMALAHRHGDRTGHHAACPYCAAAAHAPIIGHQPLLRHATGFVFAAFRFVSSHGPRGPPAPQPRARGPPSPLLFV